MKYLIMLLQVVAMAGYGGLCVAAWELPDSAAWILKAAIVVAAMIAAYLVVFAANWRASL